MTTIEFAKVRAREAAIAARDKATDQFVLRIVKSVWLWGIIGGFLIVRFIIVHS